jgi:hypothetical protein
MPVTGQCAEGEGVGRSGRRGTVLVVRILLRLALGAGEGAGYEKACQQQEKRKGNPHALTFEARVRVKSPHPGV